MQKVHIMRGLPGSGKTTLAKKFWPQAEHVSADHFMIDENGLYAFDPRRLPEAHAACLDKFMHAMRQHQVVVVDNTNLELIEIAPYYAIAEAFGAHVTVWEMPEDNPKKLFERCIHGVPLFRIEKMFEKMRQESRRWPSRWNRSIVCGDPSNESALAVVSVR